MFRQLLRFRKGIYLVFLLSFFYMLISRKNVELVSKDYLYPKSVDDNHASETADYEIDFHGNNIQSTEAEVRPAAYDPSRPKFLHVLSYQRSGSSLVGDLLQNMSRVFYVYEPLDALYTAMYGTVAGWNVPGDIFIERSGDVRVPPAAELNMTIFVMESIYNCQFSHLPYPLLMHRFLNYFKKLMPDMVKYGKCCKSKDKNLFSRLDQCNKAIQPFCKTRFGENAQNQKSCGMILYNEGQWRSNESFIRETIRKNHPSFTERTLTKVVTGFWKYFVCIGNYSRIVLPCAREYLDRPCSTYPIRAVKTVRAFADIDKYLMEKYNNFRYIHLLRDPRGTAKSRFLQKWSRGFYEQSDPGKIADSYCSIGLYNENLRKGLESKYPGRTITLIFDAITKDPREYVENMFEFISENITESSSQWLRKLERGRKTVTKKGRKAEIERMASKVQNPDIVRETQWKVFFKYSEVESMQKLCIDFFRNITYNWDGLNFLEQESSSA